MSYNLVPVGNSEIITRAIKRARLSRGSHEADFCVGFSEGIIECGKKFFTSAWCAIIATNGSCHLGGGLNIELPENLLQKKKSNLLLESDIEKFLEKNYKNPFERLVEYALISMKK